MADDIQRVLDDDLFHESRSKVERGPNRETYESGPEYSLTKTESCSYVLEEYYVMIL